MEGGEHLVGQMVLILQPLGRQPSFYGCQLHPIDATIAAAYLTPATLQELMQDRPGEVASHVPGRIKRARGHHTGEAGG
jgi:hypothetical protein